ADHAAQGMNILNAPDAARSDHRNPYRARQPRGRLDIDALHHAVPADVGVNDGLDAVVLEPLRQIDHIVMRQLRPAVYGHFAVLRVQPDDDMVRKLRRDLTHEMRRADRFGADDDVIDTGVQIPLNRLFIANPSAY